jgi:hypothetical protein
MPHTHTRDTCTLKTELPGPPGPSPVCTWWAVVCTWCARGVNVGCSGFSAPAASLQRGADTFRRHGFHRGIMKVPGPSGVRNICHEGLKQCAWNGKATMVPALVYKQTLTNSKHSRPLAVAAFETESPGPAILAGEPNVR